MIISKSASRDLKKIVEPFKSQIIDKLETFTGLSDPNVIKMTGIKNTYRLRVGGFRIVMKLLDKGEIEVLAIDDRKDIYKKK